MTMFISTRHHVTSTSMTNACLTRLLTVQFSVSIFAVLYVGRPCGGEIEACRR